MDSARSFGLPRAEDQVDVDLREVDAAIALVLRGAAVRVRLISLASAAGIAPMALARAQAAGLAFRADRAGTSTQLTVGPA